MTKKTIFLLIASAFCICFCHSIEREELFNFDWKFKKGTPEHAETSGFDDKNWRTVDLPHDWSVEDLPDQGDHDGHTISGPFDSKAPAAKNTGFTKGGIAWYRKHFVIPEQQQGKIVSLNFDGIYMNADVWINGIHVHKQSYGYTAFHLNITPYLSNGSSDNVIAIEVKNQGVNSRWYTGSGIYRDVRISYLNPIHIQPWGIYVTTPQITKEQAEVCVETQISNRTNEDQEISLKVEVINESQEIIKSKTISSFSKKELGSSMKTTLSVENPNLWSIDHPNLYRVVCSVWVDDVEVDRVVTPFGIRSIEFDAEKGMFLNDKHLQLNGGAIHSNFGSLGSAAFSATIKRNVQLMKDAGFNAIRCAHNPHSTHLFDACDEIGMLVIDEAFDTWVTPKNPDDYNKYFEANWKKDITSMLFRDRNHPSIFTWSLGNQIRTALTPKGITLAHQLADYVRSVDPTRPVTANVFMFIRKNMFDGSPDLWKQLDPFFEALDLAGYSYQSVQYENVHNRLPDRIQFSSEINSRDVFRNWTRVIDHPYVFGNFTWTAMDYFGEAGGGWINGHYLPPEKVFPWSFSYTGDFDYCGSRKPRSYYREILVEDKKLVAAFVRTPVSTFPNDEKSGWGWDDVKASWTWNGYEGQPMEVHVYSNGETVELSLNGKSLGQKKNSRSNEYKNVWMVPYEKGELVAIAYQNGKKVDEWALSTVGKSAKIRLTPDKTMLEANNMDLCFVKVEVVDERGNVVPDAMQQIHFEITGEATLAGVGNGNPMSLESFQQPSRKVFEGKALLILRSTDTIGQIQIKAASDKLDSATLEIQAI